MTCQHCLYSYAVPEGEDNGPCPACGQNPVLNSLAESKAIPSLPSA